MYDNRPSYRDDVKKDYPPPPMRNEGPPPPSSRFPDYRSYPDRNDLPLPPNNHINDRYPPHKENNISRFSSANQVHFSRPFKFSQY
jgi:hypothetical protein